MKTNTKYEILSPDGFVDFYGIQKLKKKTIEIEFENGILLRGSLNHEIYDFNGKSIFLKDIKIGDNIISHNGTLKVTNIKKYNHKTNVYDVINSGENHLYLTNNIISHNCDFLGSGDRVIPSDIQSIIMKTMVKTPVEKYMSGQLWQWKEPVEGHRYIMGVDVSRGDSEDYSAINIIDFDDREQVLEYIGKIPPDDLASIAYKWGTLYSAFIVVDITGGMGVATSRKLQEMGYKDLFIDGINTKDIWSYDSKVMEKIPGINFNNKRTQIVAALEEQLRHGFIIRSLRLANELNTFMYVNGRPDHTKGTHDDAIMSISIAIYAGDICFTQLKRNEMKNKAMLESWSVSERSYDTNKSFYSYGTSLDPIGSIQMDNSFYHRDNPTNVPKEAYKEYSWLFGKPK